MHETIERLTAVGPVVTDGAWGTQLQQRGLGPGECPDGWNLSHPDRVEEVPAAYVAAGSRVVLTNTFQSNRIALAGHGLAEKVIELNRTGVEISRSAAGSAAAVFASMGSTGKMLMTGEITEEEMLDVFAQQAGALAEAGADALVIETMADVAEAKIALAAGKTTRLPVVVSIVFDSGKDLDRTMMGTTPEQVAAELAAAGADVVGANCGQGIEGYLAICRRLRDAADVPIWIKANAGVPEMVDGRVVYQETPEQFAATAPAMVEAGASFLGGCCGTTPDFISALARRLAS